MNILNSQSLLKYNTFKVDKKSEFFVDIHNEKELIKVLENRNFSSMNKFILGGGSNILLTKNIDGIVLHNQLKGITIKDEKEDKLLIEVGAGEVWDNLVQWSTDNQLYGIENLSLIPGYVGAAPIQNIGAYGVEIKDVFHQLTAFNLHTTKKTNFNKSSCQFGYRNSIFKNQLKNQYIITKIEMYLSKKPQINTSYYAFKEKIKTFNEKNLSSQNIRDIVIDIRTSKLPNPKNIGNAGSFFKNPLVSKNTLKKLQKSYKDIPVFKNNTEIKIPAAWFIEKGGWKGYREKNCGVYKKHALIIVNHGNANGEDIQALAKKIQKDIFNKFAVRLENEVTIL